MSEISSTCSYPSPIPFTVLIFYVSLHLILFVFVFCKAKRERNVNEMKINDTIKMNNNKDDNITIVYNESIQNDIKQDNDTKNNVATHSNDIQPGLSKEQSKSDPDSLCKIFINLYSVYGTILTHMFDQASDIAVVVQFYLIYYANVMCINEFTGKNMKLYQFLISSILCLFVYRIISCIWIYTNSRNCARVLYQFFDVEIFRAINLTLKLKINEKTEPQKIIDLFEATLEAMPQLFFQTTFILMTANYYDTIIVFSVVFSFIVITLKLKSNDGKIFKALGYGFEFNISDICSLNNFVYIIRILFRWFNITSSLLLYSLMHTLGYGYYEIIMVSINVIIHVALAIKFKDFRYLSNMISTSISNISLCIISNTINLINGITIIAVIVKDKKVPLLKATIIYVYVSLFISMSISVIFTIIFVRNNIDDGHLSTNREILLINEDIVNYIAYVCFGPTTYSTIWTKDTNGKDQRNIFHILLKLYESIDQVPSSVWIFATMIKHDHFVNLLCAEDISGISPLVYTKFSKLADPSCNKGAIIEKCKALVPQLDYHNLRKFEEKAEAIAHDVLRLEVVGIGNSGKSTLLKQLGIAYGKGFYKKDLFRWRTLIYWQIRNDLCTIMETINDDMEAKNIDFDWSDLSNEIRIVNEIKYRSNKITSDVCLAIQKLWNADIIKNTYTSKKHEMWVMDSTQYFVDDLNRITKDDYLPSNNDVLLCYHMTLGFIERFYQVGGNRFRITDYGGTIVERKNWYRIPNFNETDGIIFIASLSSYNQVSYGDRNAMDETLGVFEQLINHHTHRQIPFCLFLNKSDLFKEKIKETPLTVCDVFSGYNGNANDYNECIEYIKGKFNDLNKNNERQIKIYVTCAINQDSIKNAFDDATKWMIK